MSDQVDVDHKNELDAFEAWWATYYSSEAAARSNYAWQSDGGEYPGTSETAKDGALKGWLARSSISDQPQKACWCQKCRPITMNDSRMVVCPSCGDKRCVHAKDHEAPCAKDDIFAHNNYVEKLTWRLK